MLTMHAYVLSRIVCPYAQVHEGSSAELCVTMHTYALLHIVCPYAGS